jgi:methylenetetrahydrofolate dehydrogenase (NADP+) / methenyltetrahydrofolate cyclohydrolase
VSAQLIDGKAIASKVRAEVAAEARLLAARGVQPGLAVVLVGDDPASQVYVRNKTKAGREAGLQVFDHPLPADTSEAALLALVERLNLDPTVDGILVQFPVPKHIDANKVQQAITPAKDVDGLNPASAGRLWAGLPGFVPCTPLGVMRLLEESGTEVAGADAVVLGRSNLVGKPMAALLLAAHATVTICHSRTRDLPAVVRRADIVIAAIGRPEMVRGDWIKPGATVIDVGMNKKSDGKLCGDVAFSEALPHARAITPVPGGVGPMTIALLLSNTVRACRGRYPVIP